MSSFSILTLAPVAIALLVSIAFRRVILGLVFGALSASLIVNGFSPMMAAKFLVIDLGARIVFNKNHLSIIIFTVMIGGLTGLLSKSGATHIFLSSLARRIRGPRSAQVVASLCGLFIFFDDHVNCLVVSSSMRPVLDKHNVSREKLAYLVDSTAAPVASIALVSTWIAFQVSLIHDAITSGGLDLDAYSLFITSIPYNFYALFTIMIVLLVAASGRDFGPMLRAERRALTRKRKNKEYESPHDIEGQLVLFYAPVLSLILVTFAVLYATGLSSTAKPNASLLEILSNADSYMAMLVGASVSLFIAIFLMLYRQILEPDQLLSAITDGVRDLGDALLILVFAWAFGQGLESLGVAEYLASLLAGHLAPALLPTLIFAIAALVSFVTGTSFGTMAVLMPMILPLIFRMTSVHELYLATLASVLGGAVFGDHCSPLSDTTILSSMSSRCDISSHVATQMPYALLAAILTMLLGTLPIGFGVSPTFALLLGFLAICIIFQVVGQPVANLASVFRSASAAKTLR